MNYMHVTAKGVKRVAAGVLIVELRRLLADQSARAASVRWAAAHGLYVTAASEHAGAVLQYRKREPSHLVAQQLVRTLGRDTRARYRVDRLLQDDDVRTQAVTALGEVGDVAARRFVEELTSDNGLKLRKQGIETLSKQSPE